jgi:hypothetical protein
VPASKFFNNYAAGKYEFAQLAFTIYHEFMHVKYIHGIDGFASTSDDVEEIGIYYLTASNKELPKLNSLLVRNMEYRAAFDNYILNKDKDGATSLINQTRNQLQGLLYYMPKATAAVVISQVYSLTGINLKAQR